MRLVFGIAALVLLVAPTAAGDPPTCNFAVNESRVAPSTNYWIGVERSVCRSGPDSYDHVERVLVTEGHPYAPGSVLIVGFAFVSHRTVGGDGSSAAQDVVWAQSGEKNASVTYRSDRDALGFTTCSVVARYSEPPSETTVGSGRLNACPPHELSYA